ncbi:MAG: hypothetical protein LBV23_06015 [Deltaproteobacteria bacterium]|nr:hypothetical protein [Deltaproteobacteria bacterium]
MSQTTNPETAVKSPAKLPNDEPNIKDYFLPITINGICYDKKPKTRKVRLKAYIAMIFPKPLAPRAAMAAITYAFLSLLPQ